MILDKIVASTEVITLAEARDHLRLDTSGSPATHPDDTYVTTLISVAREMAEEYQERSIGMATYRLTIPNFPAKLALPKPNIISVTSIKYDDVDDVEQTLSSSTGYWVSDGVVIFREFPSLYNKPDTIRIEYKAGYDTASSPSVDVPLQTKQAMLLFIGHLYENREAVEEKQNYKMPMATEFLLNQHRLNMGI